MSTRQFSIDDPVRLRRAWAPGHIRAPWYLRGCQGRVCHVVGEFGNPEEMAYGRTGGEKLTLYRVRFRQGDVWPDYVGSPRDTLEVEVYENWLERIAIDRTHDQSRESARHEKARPDPSDRV